MEIDRPLSMPGHPNRAQDRRHLLRIFGDRNVADRVTIKFESRGIDSQFGGGLVRDFPIGFQLALLGQVDENAHA
jgi:hypothetical protein